MRQKQHEDLEMVKILGVVQQGKNSKFKFDNREIPCYGNRVCVPDDIKLKGDIMRRHYEES